MTTADVLFEDASSVVRCLWRRGNLLYVGLEGEHPDHGLIVIDINTGATLQRAATPFLVSDVVALEGRVLASLGPGRLMEWSDQTCHDEPSIRVVDANAPKLALSPDGDLFWGTAWGDICSARSGRLGGVKKSLSTIAVGEHHIHASYEDGRVRVWDRANLAKRPKALKAGAKNVRCALLTGQLYSVDSAGEVIRWQREKLEPEHRFQVPSGRWGTHLRPGTRERLVSFGENITVRVQDQEGRVQFECTPDDPRVEDTWLDDAGLLVAAGPRLVRFAI